MPRSIFVVLVLMAFGPIAAARAERFVGCDFSGALYSVDPATGVAVAATSTNLVNLTGISSDSRGIVYGLTAYSAAGGNSLYQIDVRTGQSVLIGETGLPFVSEGDLAHQPGTGVLYAAQEGIAGFHGTSLFTLNTTTGRGTRVGLIPGTHDLSALAFSADGSLYALSTPNSDPPLPCQLLRLDPMTAAVLSSVQVSVDLGSVAGMNFNTGLLYVADGGIEGTDNLYTLEPLTGILTPVGPTGVADGLSGLTVVLPEPTMVCGVLVVVWCAAVQRWGRSHVSFRRRS